MERRKRLILGLMAVLLVAGPAWSANYEMLAKRDRAGYSLPITSAITASDYIVAPAQAINLIAFTKSSTLTLAVYACETKDYSATTCGNAKTTLSATTDEVRVYTAKPWLVFDVTAAETSGTSYLSIASNPANAGMGGGTATADADNDGLYDFAVLWDADGDGSGWVTCTAKDTPDSACKASGEVIYGDFADDLNCAVWGCGFGQMENDGTIYLQTGVYVNFPCWEPTNVTNTRGGVTDDNEHDSVSDAAWNLCPATPDPDTTRRFYTIALMDWQGEIIGSGTDTRDPATSGVIRNQGTYLVDDRGPSWNAGTNNGNNTWFSSPSFVRGINIGFEAGGIASTTAGANSGEYSGDGDSKGYGTVSGTQTVGTVASNQVICIANTSGLDTLVAGDIVEIKSTSGTVNSLSSTTVATAMRVRATPDTVTTCNGAGTFYLALGGRVGAYGTTSQYFHMAAPYATQYTNGMAINAVRSDYLDSRARIANLNIEPQDQWDESGGDCNQVTTNTSATPYYLWTQQLDGDTDGLHAADIDCDTEPLVGLWGGGAPRIEDVVIRGWHDYAIDGASNSGSPLVTRVRFFGGHGGPIMDMGSGWRADDIEIQNSQFSTSAISTFGPGLSVEHVIMRNSSAFQLAAFTEVAVGDYFNDVKIENSAVTMVYNIQCGARYNTFRHTFVPNMAGVGSINSSVNGYIARYTCTDALAAQGLVAEGNLIDDWYLEVAKSTQMTGTGATAVGIAYDVHATIANAATNNPTIIRNVTTNGRIRSRYTGINVCAVGAIDSDTAVDASDRFRAGVPFDYSHEDVLNQNIHSNLSAYASGGGGATDLVFCGCNINKSGGGGAGWATCETPVGSGSGIGADPRGCGNQDGATGVAPAIGSCS